MKTQILNLTLIALLPIAAHAEQNVTINNVVTNVNTTVSIVQSIRTQELSLNGVADLGELKRAVTTAAKTDIDLYKSLKFGAGAPSTEGIPSGNDIPNAKELIESAYSTTSLIEKALREARTKSLGDRIQMYEAYASRIIKRSGQRPTEVLVRLTLNRSVDVMRTVIQIAGNNPELVAQWIANFYEESFKLAAAWANNPNFSAMGNINSIAHFMNTVSLAEFGRVYSQLLFSFSAGLTSDSAKSVMLMKLIGYLGWDCNMDMRRREIKEVIADVYSLQHDEPVYAQIIQAIGNGQEPTQRMLSQLRSLVYEILQTLPARYQQAGIPMLMPRDPGNHLGAGTTSFIPWGVR